MPIITSSIKDLRRTARRSQHNRAAKGRLRSNLKRVRVALAENQGQAAAQALAAATPVIDRAVSKKVLHKNAAARQKSRLTRQLNRLAKPAGS
ncbi:MAG: 30S ribosomal protein S20 [Candidatus Methylomirabilota bacterium]|jgi:small subunit ribosomal protein S20